MTDAPPVLVHDKIGHSLGLRKTDFHTVVSHRAKYPAHSGSLEISAVTLGLRWAFRSKRFLGQRIPFLVDAQAVIGALRRGRTSAPTLKFEMGKIAALILATDTVVKFIYIPSSHMPADAPSRGLVSLANRARY